ncbi:hypothetical protein N007_00605 [Alicyclobacillus acidoterrestris ATCC 49025]|nr:hypothetical protein N007_00605 [Alicyclobacillus acidoterrestris ATCC 49025]
MVVIAVSDGLGLSAFCRKAGVCTVALWLVVAILCVTPLLVYWNYYMLTRTYEHESADCLFFTALPYDDVPHLIYAPTRMELE